VALGGSKQVLIGIVADVHDSLDALKAILTRFREVGVQQIVSLGDAFETYKPGDPGPEVGRMLQNTGAIGVWGNHDVGLSYRIPDEVRKKADPELLEYTKTFRPQIVVENCRFSHVEPWLDPTKIEDLWHFEGVPNRPEYARRSLDAVQEQFLFVGHYHVWAITSSVETVEWNATEKISLSLDQRYVVLTAAAVHGWSAVFDSAKAELMPIRVSRDYRDRPSVYDEKPPPN